VPSSPANPANRQIAGAGRHWLRYRQPHVLERIARRLSLWAYAIASHLRMVYVLVRFLLQADSHYYATLFRGRRLLRRLQSEPLPPSPLRAHGSQIFEVDPAWLERQRSEPPDALALPPGMVVLHFTGTGETRHGPLTGLERLLKWAPELATARHYVVDAPIAAAAYTNALSFASQTWPAVEPIIDGHPGPFLCIGLSRGGLAASHAMRAPHWIGRPIGRVFAGIQTFVTCCVLAELRLHDERNMYWTLRDVLELDAVSTSLRLTREFSLLARSSQSELTHFLHEVVETARLNPRFAASLCWGMADTWTRAESNLRLVQNKDLPSVPHSADSGRMQAVVLEGYQHALNRQPTAEDPRLAETLGWTLQRIHRMLQSLKTYDDRRAHWDAMLGRVREARRLHESSEE
jgi:hypothetical protein